MSETNSNVFYRLNPVGAGHAGHALLALGGAFSVAALPVVARLEGGIDRLAWSYLVAFMFYLSISLGALFFVMLHHLTGARWSIVLRRVAEVLMMNNWLMLVLFIPILLWLPTLFEWARPLEQATNPELLAHKRPYLNPEAFGARAIVYFGAWIGLTTLYWRNSLAHDVTGRHQLLQTLRRWSAPGMIIFALTLTFASFDWLMSLDPYWFSTIYGVYYFAGSALAIMATLILVALGLGAAGAMRGAVSVEHFHDLGKLLFGFVVFWAYIAFSQMMLIWMANIPEETFWFFHRWEAPGWQAWSWFLVIGHFIAPFIFLLPRTVKRTRPLLALAALWMLLVHWADLFWLIMPIHDHHHVPFHPLLDGVVMLAMGLVFVGFVILRLRRQALVPLRDPYLGDSIAFENH